MQERVAVAINLVEGYVAAQINVHGSPPLAKILQTLHVPEDKDGRQLRPMQAQVREKKFSKHFPECRVHCESKKSFVYEAKGRNGAHRKYVRELACLDFRMSLNLLNISPALRKHA